MASPHTTVEKPFHCTSAIQVLSNSIPLPVAVQLQSIFIVTIHPIYTQRRTCSLLCGAQSGKRDQQGNLFIDAKYLELCIRQEYQERCSTLQLILLACCSLHFLHSVLGVL